MRFSILILANILYALPAKCQSIKDLDKQNGYERYSFNMSVDSVIKKSNAILDSSSINKDLSFYRMENERFLKFGEFFTLADLIKSNADALIYGFHFQFLKFFKPEYELIKTWLISLYGPPTQQDDILNRYQWRGTTSEITLIYDEAAKLTNLALINLIAREKLAYRRRLRQHVE